MSQSLDVPTLISAMAARIRLVPGVASAHETPPNFLEDSDLPAVVLFWHDTMLAPNTDGWTWLPQVRAQLLVAREGDTPEEYTAVWSLITPIVDAFGTGHTSERLPGLPGHVDRVMPSQSRPVLPSLLIGYAGHVYFGAEIYFDAKFHRYDEGLP